MVTKSVLTAYRQSRGKVVIFYLILTFNMTTIESLICHCFLYLALQCVGEIRPNLHRKKLKVLPKMW